MLPVTEDWHATMCLLQVRLRVHKSSNQGLGANKSRTERAIRVLTNKLTALIKTMIFHGAHEAKSAKRDLAKIQKELTSSKVFTIVPAQRFKKSKY